MSYPVARLAQLAARPTVGSLKAARKALSYLAPPAKCRRHFFHHKCPQPRASYHHTPILCVDARAYPPPCTHVLAASQPRTPAAPRTRSCCVARGPYQPGPAHSQPHRLANSQLAGSQPCGPTSQACRIAASRYRSLAASLAASQPCGLAASLVASRPRGIPRSLAASRHPSQPCGFAALRPRAMPLRSLSTSRRFCVAITVQGCHSCRHRLPIWLSRADGCAGSISGFTVSRDTGRHPACRAEGFLATQCPSHRRPGSSTSIALINAG